MQRIFLSFLLLLISLISTRAQSFKTINQSVIWGGLTVVKQMENDWRLSAVMEERRYLQNFRAQQRIHFKMGVDKKYNEKWLFDAGIWIFSIYGPADADLQVSDETHEWRLYLSGRYALNPRWALQLKSELRTFMEDGAESHFDGGLRENNFIRERLKIIFSQPITNKLKFTASEEVHLNVANTSGQAFQSFDQNRFAAKFSYRFSSMIKVNLGYLYWFQPTGAVSEYFSRHIATSSLSITF